MKEVHPIVLEILKKRGISGQSEISEFLSRKPQRTYDPFLLHDMEAGVDFILSAIKEKRRICIYGDYDADGVVSICILMDFLGHLTENLEYYIPSRFDEGYGLNKEAIKKLKEAGTELLLTVDCGSISLEEVEYAKEIGLDVVVTDHHNITDTWAKCILINPKQKDCSYPFSYLAGCGVAFKLTQALRQKTGLPKKVLNRGLDLTAIGTVGDIVPLIDENRTLVKYGLRALNQTDRPGLKRLVEEISFRNNAISAQEIAFGIAPHLNAAGRMGDARAAVNLLLASNAEEIQKNVTKLIEYNRQRKQLQEKTYQDCAQIIRQEHSKDPFLVVDAGEAHEGIAGIVAGKLKDDYHRPTILLTYSGDGLLKGTGRSIEAINLYKMLKKHDKLFQRFGGHGGACGFTMEQKHLEELANKLKADMKQSLKKDSQLLEKKVEAELPLTGSDLTLELAQAILSLAPFGHKNPKPTFKLEQVQIEKQYPMGQDKSHIRFVAQCKDGKGITCVLFRKAKDNEELLYGGAPVDLIGSVEPHEWRGKKEVQFIVETVI